MKKLLPYLKNYIKESVFAPLFKLLEASFELVVPLVIASLIDKGIRLNDNDYIIRSTILLLLFAFFGMVMAITAQYYAAKAATGFGKELRHSLFKNIQSLSFSELDTLGTSSLITRMTNDTTQVQNGVNLILRLFLRSPFIVIGATVMAFTIDVKCALIFLVAVTLLSIVVFSIMSKTMPGYKNIQKNLDVITLKTRENLVGSRVIRAFTLEDKEIKEFNKQNEYLSHLQRSLGRVSSLLNPITFIIINVAIIILVYTGSLKVDSGVLTQGQVVALYNYMSQILVELIKLANLIITVTKSFASASRIENVLNQKSTLEHIDDKTAYSNALVEFKDVSLTYQNAGDASLSNISFSANKGDKIGIIGSTGSGKSSLVSLIAHYYDATSGDVFVDGLNVKAYDDKSIYEKISFVFQKAVLFKGTVRDNIKMGNENATDIEINDALKKAQVLSIIEEKGGLDTKVSQNGLNFSGGQKQRLSVARAFAKKSEILVLDDSSSALDFATESKLRKEIYSLNYNPLIFIVSQRASSVMACDKIIVLDDGKMVGFAPHDELMKTCEIYKEIFNNQFVIGDYNEK